MNDVLRIHRVQTADDILDAYNDRNEAAGREVLANLYGLSESNYPVTAHLKADDALALFVRRLGFTDVADLYERVEKY